MKTQAGQLYNEFDKHYWRNRLPQYRVIRRGSLPDGCLGICNNRTKTILLRRDLTGEMLRLTILHEMCHIGPNVGYDHGPHFLRKLRRLARLGEPKLLEDIERYDGTADERKLRELEASGKLGPDISFRDAVLSDLEGASYDARASRRRWPRIRRWLAGQYRMNAAQFQRCAPWAEREWRRLTREARSLERAKKVRKARERLHELAHVVTPEDLKRTRERLGITKTELAWMLGVHRGMVARWEAGLRRIPRFVVHSRDEAQAKP